MANNTKQTVDGLLSSITDEELRSFVSTYAVSHPEMLEALKKKQHASSKKKAVAFDYVKEVKDCYRHFMKTPRWERRWDDQPQYLDWEEVGRDLRRVIRFVGQSIEAGKPELAVETAFLILEMDERQYDEDYLREREDWDCDDLCIDDCLELIQKAMASPVMSKDGKLAVCDRLEKFLHSEILVYTEFDADEFIDEVRGSLLTDDEHLAVMIRSFKEERGWRMDSMACDIWDFMMQLGRVGEAEAFYLENPEMDEVLS